jgi:hypothetical protein
MVITEMKQSNEAWRRKDNSQIRAKSKAKCRRTMVTFAHGNCPVELLKVPLAQSTQTRSVVGVGARNCSNPGSQSVALSQAIAFPEFSLKVLSGH